MLDKINEFFKNVVEGIKARPYMAGGIALVLFLIIVL